MKITVVVRTCNRPHFLKECLASVELQNHKDWEVLIFDDSAGIENFEIYKKFKSNNPDNKVVYLTSATPYEMFRDSWLVSPDIAKGDIMVRLDDDDLLAEDTLSFVSKLYEDNPDLDFTYGTAVTFNDDDLLNVMNIVSPIEAPKTYNAWAGYVIPNNRPWKEPYCWYVNHYTEPQHYTSIIHCSKSNITCVFHLYTMRTESVKRVKDKITVTSKYVDDLEFFGSLDYLGLTHTSIHKILSYVRAHSDGRVSDIGRMTDGTTLWDDILGIRDKVDELRPAGFHSRVVNVMVDGNHNEGITATMKYSFTEYYDKIKSKINEY